MSKGEKKKKTEESKRKRNREAKNEEILEQFHKIRDRSEKKRKLMEEAKKAMEEEQEEKTEIREEENSKEEKEEKKEEEKEKKEKKHHREKKHKKHHKKDGEKGSKEEEDEDEKAIQQEAETPAAIEYLREWYTNRDEWKFKKNRQTWLLKHVFDPKMLGVKDFKIFLAYVQDMQGRCREELLEKARKMVEEIVVTDKKDEKSTIDRIQKKRAEKLVEMYSE